MRTVRYTAVQSYCISVCSYGKWGAINKRGETTIAFEYDYIGNFSNNKAFAVKNGIECYIINQNGDIEYTYTNTNFLTGRYHNYLPYDFSEKTGIAMVKNEDYYYLITNTGKAIMCASTSPVTFAGTGGVSRGFLDKNSLISFAL